MCWVLPSLETCKSKVDVFWKDVLILYFSTMYQEKKYSGKCILLQSGAKKFMFSHSPHTMTHMLIPNLLKCPCRLYRLIFMIIFNASFTPIVNTRGMQTFFAGWKRCCQPEKLRNAALEVGGLIQCPAWYRRSDYLMIVSNSEPQIRKQHLWRGKLRTKQMKRTCFSPFHLRNLTRLMTTTKMGHVVHS